MIVAIDVQRFMPVPTFVKIAEEFSARLTAAPPAPGVSQVLMPGEPEFRTRERRSTEGVPLPAQTYDALRTLLAELQLSRPDSHHAGGSRD